MKRRNRSPKPSPETSHGSVYYSGSAFRPDRADSKASADDRARETRGVGVGITWLLFCHGSHLLIEADKSSLTLQTQEASSEVKSICIYCFPALPLVFKVTRVQSLQGICFYAYFYFLVEWVFFKLLGTEKKLRKPCSLTPAWALWYSLWYSQRKPVHSKSRRICLGTLA